MPLSPAKQKARRARLAKLAEPKKPVRRRKCLNCDELFRPERPYPVQKFCKDACRKEFHANGGNAFGPLKARLEKLIRVLCRDAFGELEKGNLDLGKRFDTLLERFNLLLSVVDPKRDYGIFLACPFCRGNSKGCERCGHTGKLKPES